VRMLGRMLDSPVRRYQVIGAYSGREALAMMGHRQPDLVLLDLMMPDVDGFEVIERMHSNPVWRDIPIVVVSAQDEAGDYEVLGGVVMVTKATGLVPGEVITWVRNLVGTAGESPPVPSVRRAVPVL
jgi:CheY-like chemotaxis protein